MGIEKDGTYPYHYNGLSEKQADPTGKGYFYETNWRGYDPQLGRFKGLDAMAGATPGISPYSYAFNNPILLNDPSGLIVLPVLEVIGKRILPIAASEVFGHLALNVATQLVASTAFQAVASTVGGCCPGSCCPGSGGAQGSQSSGGQQQEPEEKKALNGNPFATKPKLQIPRPSPKPPLPPPAVPRPLGPLLMRTLGTSVLVLMPHTLNGPELEWLDQQNAKQWAFEQLTPEEIGEALRRLERGEGDKFDQQVRHWIDTNWDTDAKRRHHYASDKHESYYKPLFEKIAAKYGLNLDGDWNTDDYSPDYHNSTHHKSYHEFVLSGMQQADREAAGDREKFLYYFDKYVKAPVRLNPRMLTHEYWK